MTKYVHIVQVHPVENGEVNGYKVRSEKEFTNREEAVMYVDWFNTRQLVDPMLERTKAVYLGRVNDATGELE
jgi:hypothetical protein